MGDERRTPTEVTHWVFGFLGAIVLYVLSFGPVIFFISKTAPRPYSPEVKWVGYFYTPLIWLHDHTPLKGPLEAYGKWWEDLAKHT